MSDCILGVEIGGTKLQLALGTPDGVILDTLKEQVNVSDGGDGIRHWLETNIPVFISDVEKRFGQVTAIGCGFGGPLDHHQGRVLQSIQISGWEDFPIRDWFMETFSLPTTVDNDSNAAAWGEYCLGFGKGCRHFFYTNIGSGVGGGFVFNGQLYNGQGFGLNRPVQVGPLKLDYAHQDMCQNLRNSLINSQEPCPMFTSPTWRNLLNRAMLLLCMKLIALLTQWVWA